MKIEDVLSIDSIDIDVKVTSKNEALQKLVELASKTGKVNSPEGTLKEVFAREQIMSTGIGKGLALPHAKTNHVETCIGALAIFKNKLEFDSLDGAPIDMAFLLLGREKNVGAHLRLLSKLSRFLNDEEFKASIVNSESAQEVLNLFAAREAME